MSKEEELEHVLKAELLEVGVWAVDASGIDAKVLWY